RPDTDGASVFDWSRGFACLDRLRDGAKDLPAGSGKLPPPSRTRFGNEDCDRATGSALGFSAFSAVDAVLYTFPTRRCLTFSVLAPRSLSRFLMSSSRISPSLVNPHINRGCPSGTSVLGSAQVWNVLPQVLRTTAMNLFSCSSDSFGATSRPEVTS